MFKLAVLVCAQALFVCISGQCIGAGLAPLAPLVAPCETFAPVGLLEPCWGAFGLGPAALAASNGAGLAVTSVSPLAPTGVRVTSENAYEGPLAVTGAVPFLGAVALEGALPTAGAGAISYACGDGNVAIVSENAAPFAPYGAYAYDGLAGPYGFAGPYDGFAGRGPYGYPGYGCAGPFY